MEKHYVYAFLREDFQTPYYIGKGTGDRRFVKAGRKCPPPADKARIKIIKENLSDEEACAIERTLILFWGKKTDGGILNNFCDGGNGGATRGYGWHWDEETKAKIREGNKGKKHTEETKEKLRKISTGKVATEEKRVKCSIAGKKARGIPKGDTWNKKPCTYKGIDFPTMTAAAEHFGHNISSVHGWLKRRNK